MQYMLKWPDLYLSNSAYLAKYMDPALVVLHGLLTRHRARSSTPRTIRSSPWSGHRGRARDLPLSARAADAFMGGTALRLLNLPPSLQTG